MWSFRFYKVVDNLHKLKLVSALLSHTEETKPTVGESIQTHYLPLFQILPIWMIQEK